MGFTPCPCTGFVGRLGSVHHTISDRDTLLAQLKQIIARRFRLSTGTTDALSADEPLIGGRLGLDSLDALELALDVEEKFGIFLGSVAETRTSFTSLASLADFIRHHPPLQPVAA